MRDVNLRIRKNEITAFIGPSGCGKSTVLRCFNRMNDLIDGARVEGNGPVPRRRPVRPGGQRGRGAPADRHGVPEAEPVPEEHLRQRRLRPARQRASRARASSTTIVEQSLRGAALWDEVKDRLKASALGLSGGQQQRLCIARAIAVEPEVILMDEPCSALDPIATARIEDLMQEIKQQYTIVIVTHNMQQAARVSDRTAFFTTEVNAESDRRTGVLVEFGAHDEDVLEPSRRTHRAVRHRTVRLMDELRKNFHHELDEARAELVRLAASVTEVIPRATAVLLDGDLEGADYIIQGDDEIDARSLDLEERCYRILALQAPVASDLRQVVALLKMIAEVERSADLVCNICKAARRIYGHDLDPKLRGIISRMGEQAQQLYTAAIEAFVENDAAKAAALDDMDAYLDELQKQFVQAIFESHAAGRIDLQVAVQLAVVARFYERIGDHAVNIGERVRFVITGWLPEHHGAAALPAARSTTPASCHGSADQPGAVTARRDDASSSSSRCRRRSRHVERGQRLVAAVERRGAPTSPSARCAARSGSCSPIGSGQTLVENVAASGLRRPRRRAGRARRSSATCAGRCAARPAVRTSSSSARRARCCRCRPSRSRTVARWSTDRRRQRAGPPRRRAHRLRRQHQPRAEDAGRRARGAGRGAGRQRRRRRRRDAWPTRWSTRRTVRRAPSTTCSSCRGSSSAARRRRDVVCRRRTWSTTPSSAARAAAEQHSIERHRRQRPGDLSRARRATGSWSRPSATCSRTP